MSRCSRIRTRSSRRSCRRESRRPRRPPRLPKVRRAPRARPKPARARAAPRARRTPRADLPPSARTTARARRRGSQLPPYHRAVPDEPRYDSIAEGYALHWGPVIRPAAERLLDLIQPDTGARLLDIGTGTGVLAVEALRRWPSIEVVGVDPSSEMLDRAARDADERLELEARARLSFRTAFAADVPFPAADFDLAVSSFVLQLVPSRKAALA